MTGDLKKSHSQPPSHRTACLYPALRAVYGHGLMLDQDDIGIGVIITFIPYYHIRH